MIRTLVRLASMGAVLIVILAIWRVNGGSAQNVVDSIWNILSTGADMLIKLWNQFMAAGGSSSGA